MSPHVAIDLRIADPAGMELTGLGRHALEVARALPAARPDWRFTLFSNRPELLPTGAPVAGTRWPTANAVGRLAWLHGPAAGTARRRGADLWFAPISALPRWWRGPAVSTIHDLVFLLRPDLYRGRLNALHATWAARRAAGADGVICVSSAVREQAIDRLGASPDGTVVIGNGVSDAFRTEGPAASGPPYLLFVGTFEARKGLDTLADALSRLADRPRVVLAGRPGWGAGDALAQLTGDADVTIVGDPPDSELARLYRGAAALVYPSRIEGFGLPVAEAMASGCPVIASDLPEIREWAGEGPCYVPPADATALAAAIRELRDEGAERERRRRLGQETAAELAWPEIAQRTATVIEEVLGRAAH